MKDKTIKRLINNGQVFIGYPNAAVELVDCDQFEWRSPMGFLYPRWWRRMKYNQFQFYSVTHPDWIIGVALVDLKWIGNAFLYVWNRKTGGIVEHSALDPLARNLILPLSPDQGVATFRSGKGNISLQAEAGMRTIEAELDDMRLKLTLDESAGFEPMRVSTRAGADGWVYTQKGAGVSASGTLWLDGNEHQLAPEATLGSYDWTAGFMRRETFWNWACLSGFTRGKQRVGLNLAAGVNETGYLENCCWVDGERTNLGLARFDYDRRAPEKPWQVSTSDGAVDVLFESAGCRAERISAGLIASNFKQFFGVFNGTIDTANGLLEVVDMPGIVEDHYAKW